MAVDYGLLSGMTQPQAIDYLRNMYNIGSVLPDFSAVGDGNGGTNYYSSASPYINDQLGRAYLTSVFDPSYEGGTYGSYYVPFDAKTGQITGDPQFAKGERSGSWMMENLDTIGPLSVALLAGYGALAGGLGGGAAGAAGDVVGGINSGSLFGGAGALDTAGLDSLIASLGPANGLNLTGLGLPNYALAASNAAADPFAWGTPEMYANPTGTAASNAVTAATAGNSPATFWDTVANAGSGVSSALGGAKGLTSLAGGLLGLGNALSAPDSETTTQERTHDPRVDAAIWGQEGNAGLFQMLMQELAKSPSAATQGAWNVANSYFTPR